MHVWISMLVARCVIKYSVPYHQIRSGYAPGMLQTLLILVSNSHMTKISTSFSFGYSF